MGHKDIAYCVEIKTVPLGDSNMAFYDGDEEEEEN